MYRTLTLLVNWYNAHPLLRVQCPSKYLLLVSVLAVAREPVTLPAVTTKDNRTCKVCGMICTDMRHLQQHADLTHHFPCPICDVVCVSVAARKKHRLRHGHVKSLNTHHSATCGSEEQEVVKAHPCVACGAAFETCVALKQHLKEKKHKGGGKTTKKKKKKDVSQPTI